MNTSRLVLTSFFSPNRRGNTRVLITSWLERSCMWRTRVKLNTVKRIAGVKWLKTASPWHVMKKWVWTFQFCWSRWEKLRYPSKSLWKRLWRERQMGSCDSQWVTHTQIWGPDDNFTEAGGLDLAGTLPLRAAIKSKCALVASVMARRTKSASGGKKS